MQALFSNVTDKLGYHAWRRPDHPALIDRGRVIPYRELDRLVRQTATMLRKQFGLDAAAVYLGHARANVTQMYAALDGAQAAEIARKVG